MAAARGKSNVGVSLEELLKSLGDNQLEMSADIKKIVSDEDARKVQEKANRQRSRRPTKNVPEGGPASDTHLPQEAYDPTKSPLPTDAPKSPVAPKDKPQKKKQSSNPSSSFAKGFLKNFFGKDLAAKLMKKSGKPILDEIRPAQRSDDIKAIKADIQQIKDYLFNQKKPLGSQIVPRRGIWKSFTSGLVRSKIKPKTVSRPATASRTKQDHMAVRIPAAAAPAMVNQLHDTISAEVQATPNMTPVVPKAINDQNGAADQQKATDTKLEATREDEAKSTHDKLDKILKILDDMKKKFTGGQQSRGFGVGVMGLLGGLLSNLLKPISAVVGGIVKSLKWAWGNITKLGSKLIDFTKDMARSASTALKGGWNKVKNILTKTKSAAAAEAEQVGSKAASLGSKLTRVARVGGKALGITGAAVSVGMGVKDLVEGKKQTELPSGWDTIDPFKWGAYAGEKINEGAEKVLGDSIGGKVYDLTHKTPIVNKTNIGTVNRTPSQLPNQLSKVSIDNAAMKSKSNNEPTIVVVQGDNKTVVQQVPAQSTPEVIIQTRNPEPSVDAVNAGLFDAPQGYSALSRM